MFHVGRLPTLMLAISCGSFSSDEPTKVSGVYILSSLGTEREWGVTTHAGPQRLQLAGIWLRQRRGMPVAACLFEPAGGAVPR